MAIGVNLPKKPQGNSNALFQLAGMGAGAFAGGPAGAAAGGSIGGAVGGMANRPEAQVQPVEANALSRRQDQIAEHPQIQLTKSIEALSQIQDPVQRASLAEPLMRARKMASEYGGY